jgi:hypothetical protein
LYLEGSDAAAGVTLGAGKGVELFVTGGGPLGNHEAATRQEQ